ncbi:hypothetical protein D3C83_97860 [compost metagenome]
MAGLGGVDEHRRRPGRGQGGGDLARHMAGLADAGADDAALGAEQGLDRLGEIRAQAVGQLAQRLGLDRQDPARDSNGVEAAH